MVLRVLAIAAAALGAAAFAPPADRPEPHPSNEQGMSLRVATYNIRYGTAPDGEDRWERRGDAVADLLRDADADIIGLQEALRSQIDEIRAALGGYADVGVGRDDGRTGGEHAPILYDADRFALAEAGTFWLSDNPEQVASRTWGNSITRICTWARLIDRRAGAGIYIYNTHFDHQSQPSRERAAALLLERIAARNHPADPVVVMGDLNADEANPAVLALLAGGLRHAFREVHPDEPRAGTFNGFDPAKDGSGAMIDHVLVGEGVEVLRAEIDRRRTPEGRWPSDHFPMIVDLRLPSARER